jgi:hypothetical protein
MENCWYEQGSIHSEDGSGTLYLGGGVGGAGSGGTFTNCRSLAPLVSGTRTTTAYVGGFVGDLGNVQLKNCYANTEVRASGRPAAAGGFAGYWSHSNPHSDITISETFATGNVSASGSGDNVVAGGFIGLIYRSTGEAGTMSLSNLYALGDVSVDRTAAGTTTNNTAAGGLVGAVYNHISGNTIEYTIQHCFAAGTVSAKSAVAGNVYSGGIIGSMNISGAVNLKNNASLGTSFTVTGGSSSASTVGRIYGYLSSSVTDINYNYGWTTASRTYGATTTTTSTSNLTGQHGYNTTTVQFIDPNFWLSPTGLGFNNTAGGMGGIQPIWDFSSIGSYGYPKLKNVGGQ